jgi:hypothetical protein
MTKEHNVEISFHNFKNIPKYDIVQWNTRISLGLKINLIVGNLVC